MELAEMARCLLDGIRYQGGRVTSLHRRGVAVAITVAQTALHRQVGEQSEKFRKWLK